MSTNDPAPASIEASLETSPGLPDVSPENREDLYGRAVKHMGQVKRGQFLDYKQPLSAQLRSDKRKLYPSLKKMFDDCDGYFAEARRRVVCLQLGLTLLLTFYLALAIMATRNLGTPTEATIDTLSDLAVSWPVVLMAVIACVAVVFGDRTHNVTGNHGTSFGTWFNTRYEVLVNKCENAARNVSNDNATKDSGGVRAKHWSTIAMFLAETGNALDSYTTTNAWRIRTSLSAFSWIGRGVRFVMIGGAAAAALAGSDLVPLEGGLAPFYFGLIAVPLLIEGAALMRRVQGCSACLWMKNYGDTIVQTEDEQIRSRHVFTLISDVMQRARADHVANVRINNEAAAEERPSQMDTIGRR